MYALKEDMESALIFVRSCSVHASDGLGHADAWPNRLVYFLLPSQRSYSSKQDLKANPADETVYYLRQHSTILFLHLAP
jgi:hypothetical protein